MKPTVWALHGAVGMAADWKDLGREVAKRGAGFRAVDLWRFLDCCPMPLARFGPALNEEVKAVPGPRVLLGYSMGGRLALHALLAEPGIWDAAVIVSAHPGLTDEAERAARRAADAEWAAAALRDGWDAFLRRWESQGIFAETAAPIGDRRLLRPRRAAVARSFVDWSLGAQENLVPRLAEISTRTIWLAGERDEKFVEQGKRAIAAFPQAEARVVPGCGHRVPWEKPETLAAVLEELF